MIKEQLSPAESSGPLEGERIERDVYPKYRDG
ncbi:hypothetical protein V1280_001406 [Bradyrhizobium sp. AZCC 2230]